MANPPHGKGGATALRPISRRKLVKRLREFGFDEPKPGGKHLFMVKGNLRLRIPNPHGQQDIGPNLLSRILKEAGIDRGAWTDDSG